MKSLKGQLLVASPQLLDPNFYQTVVLIVQHDTNGALGLVLNRPTDTSIREAWRQVSQEECERQENLNWGGPCQGILMLLHTDADASEIEVVPGVHFTTDAQRIQQIIQRPHIPARFFIGYAGWSPGQLEGEMETGSWLTAPASYDEVFNPEDAQWVRIKRRVMIRNLLGHDVNPKIIPDDPSMN